jgi:hypothetical protein
VTGVKAAPPRCAWRSIRPPSAGRRSACTSSRRSGWFASLYPPDMSRRSSRRSTSGRARLPASRRWWSQFRGRPSRRRGDAERVAQRHGLPPARQEVSKRARLDRPPPPLVVVASGGAHGDRPSCDGRDCVQAASSRSEKEREAHPMLRNGTLSNQAISRAPHDTPSPPFSG